MKIKALSNMDMDMDMANTFNEPVNGIDERVLDTIDKCAKEHTCDDCPLNRQCRELWNTLVVREKGYQKWITEFARLTGVKLCG